MKIYRGSTKIKKQKRAIKGAAAATIAQRYLELRRLREMVSEAATTRNVR